jgi:branched-subunit amino acid transport protein
MDANMFIWQKQPLLIIGFVTRLTRCVPLVEQELLTLPEHLSSLPVFSGVRVTRSLVLYVCFVDHCLSCQPSHGGDRKTFEVMTST